MVLELLLEAVLTQDVNATYVVDLLADLGLLPRRQGEVRVSGVRVRVRARG